MSLIKCPECKKNLSDKAEVCINCGYPIKEQLKIQKENDIIKTRKKKYQKEYQSLVFEYGTSDEKLGLASSKIGKTKECKTCGYKW